MLQKCPVSYVVDFFLSGERMPAPTQAVIQAALTQALIGQGFLQQVQDPISGALMPASPPQLTPAKAKEVQAIATAISQVWDAWQKAQSVAVVQTTGLGVGPTALP